jgi:hypothetical protein
MMRFGKSIALTLAFVLAGAAARDAAAGVVVTVDGNTAHAEISLTDGSGATYDADVTITFDSPVNLTPDSLGLSAQLINPNDPLVTSRLPLNLQNIDPAFPVLITVEPPNLGWLFTSGFDGNEDGTGNLSFLNTYEFEIHTHDLVYADQSPYRIVKAPIGGVFFDFTEDILPGSVRARGREGAFSQFMVVKDSYTDPVTMLLLVAVPKLLALQVRVLAAVLTDVVNLDLVRLLADITADLALLGLDLTGAIEALDQLIAEVTAHAGVDIANQWNAEHTVTNDAGEILGLAQTLRFTLVRLQTL